MNLEGISVPVLPGTQSCRPPPPMRTREMKMQDSRAARDTTKSNRFALEFHPRGIS